MKKFLRETREILSDCIVFAMGVFFTWHFIQIKLHSYSYVYENTPWILWAELVMAPLIAILGIERFIEDITRFWRKK
ncbi:MAG TPA: hypothetical protein VMW13_09975 [Dehalococcoidales bacterium]|nr:hypothetical protein [Dehalococcoidales bacterium]